MLLSVGVTYSRKGGGRGLSPRASTHHSIGHYSDLFSLPSILQSKPATKSAKPATGKSGKAAPKHKFIIDYSRPAADQIFDTAGFEKFLHDHIKVDGKEGNLSDKVKISKSTLISHVYDCSTKSYL